MNKLLSAVALVVAVSLAPDAYADNYPPPTIRMVAPLGVGGSTDIVGRIMADAMGKQLGQTIVVENTTGAGGTIGEGRVAHSTPDGSNIAIGQWGTNRETRP